MTTVARTGAGAGVVKMSTVAGSNCSVSTKVSLLSLSAVLSTSTGTSSASSSHLSATSHSGTGSNLSKLVSSSSRMMPSEDLWLHLQIVKNFWEQFNCFQSRARKVFEQNIISCFYLKFSTINMIINVQFLFNECFSQLVVDHHQHQDAHLCLLLGLGPGVGRGVFTWEMSSILARGASSLLVSFIIIIIASVKCHL